ncbi:MAG: hypothetical protein NT062_38165, partial [Proteobacteria bacterium]|nr:hypothetical protein [Pseudomonadota bacterium]
PDGFCAVGPPLEARDRPLVASAGEGVLVVGGTGPSGPRSSGEYYDSSTGTFVAVELPEALRDPVEGLAGVVLARLPDGRVALTGGVRGVVSVFDPVTRDFGPVLAISRRAFHAAIAIDEARQIVAGGCANVVAGGCDGTPLRSSLVLALDGTQVGAPNLPPGSVHEGATLFDLGADVGGVRRFVLAGGFGDAGAGARFGLDDPTATALAGLGARAVGLDGGGVLTAFGRDVDPASGIAAVVAPEGEVRAIAPAPALAGAQLVTLEDGGVVAIGGTIGGVSGRVARYAPTSDGWEVVAPNPDGDDPGALTMPALARLADGTVFVVAATGAWIYRPSLVGPSSGTVTVLPQAPIRGATLVPSDPATVTRANGWTLTSPDDRLRARALVGGPRFARGSIAVTAHGIVGGFALIAQQQAPGRAILAELVDGMPTRLRRIDGRAPATVLCTGSVLQLGLGPTIARLAIGDAVTITVNDVVVLSCDAALADVGAWGVAALGTGSQVAIDV